MDVKTKYESIAKMCQELLDLGPVDRELGICHSLSVRNDKIYYMCCAVFDEIVEQWPKFSGSYTYPIPPDGSGQVTAPSAFNYCDDLWAGEQGVLRRELLQFIIDTCKDRILALSFPQRDIGPFRALLVE